MSQQADSDSDSAAVTRRRLLHAAGATGAAGIAGCGGQTGSETTAAGGDTTAAGDETTTAGGGDTEVVDQSFVSVSWVNPSQAQFNPWGTSVPINFHTIEYDPMGALNNIKRGPNIIPYLVDWSWDGKTVTLEFRDKFRDGNYTWHNGDEVTARDLTTQLKIEKYANVNPLIAYPYDPYKFISSVQQAGDYAVDIETKSESMNQRIVTQVLTSGGGFGPQLHTKHSVYRKHLEALQDATTDKERNKAKSTLRQRKISEPIGNGPFQFKSMNARRIVMERYPDHPEAEHINWNRFEFIYEPSGQKITQDLIGNKLDGYCCASGQKSKTRQYPDNLRTWFMSGIYGGKGINFDHSDEFFGKRKVRQAIAYVVNRRQVSDNAFPLVSEPTQRPMGIHNIGRSDPKEWVGDLWSEFNTYGVDQSMTDEAAALMREAGYTKKGDWWRKPNGEKISFNYIEGTEQEKIRFGRTVTQQLQDFGLDAKFTTMEETSYEQRVQAGDWRIITSSPEAWLPHPYFLMDKVFAKSAIWMGKNNYPDTVSVPMPIGNPQGSSQEFNTDSLLETLKKKRKQEAKDIVQTLAWIVNQDLPVLRVYDSGDETVLAHDDWKWPTAGLPQHDDKQPLQYNPEKIHRGLEVKWPFHWMTCRTDDFQATK